MAAATFNIEAYSDALVVLGTAGVVVPLVQRWGINSVLGYLCAGAVLGPLGLGAFKGELPFLYWMTVVDAKNVAAIAELGVVFLLFVIGLELSYQRLQTMRRLVFGLGTLQVVLSTAAIGAVFALAGQGPQVALVIGACLALSSTAIVIEVLASQRRLTTAAGRASFSVLLAQDLAVVPILLTISILGRGDESGAFTGVMLAVATAVLAIGLIVLVGRLFLKPLFGLVSAFGMNDLFVAAILFVIVGAATAAGVAGLPMSLGAFVAGLLLAESEYRKAIEATIEPFKGLLLGMFFFTVGMNIDPRELVREPLLLALAVIGFIALKSSLLVGLARLFQVPWPAAIETGLLLGPGGEFAFVGIGMASAVGLVGTETSSFTLAVTSISMALIPFLAQIDRRLSSKFEKPKARDPSISIEPKASKGHALIVGHGRVGQVVANMLERHKFPYIAIDSDATTISEHRRRGHEVYYGDATNPAFLKSCGIEDAVGVVITIHSQDSIDAIVKAVRAIRPDVPVVARARDAEHARRLYLKGVTDAVPETIEASLQLSEATLVGLGVPTGLVIASIHEKRDEFRHELQKAATEAGLVATRSIRPKAARRPS
ncbi:MAG: cation:proton antiporter [Hyphomicrobium sp.]|uniref:cation:proton antiporter domain-containing protein n=1 Tax=Hyphomicrobium sp. TaxID=82 RepID=UPI003D0BB54A